MGHSIHSVEGLIAPLELVDERLIDLPRSSELHVTQPSQDYKVIFYLGADHQLDIPHRPTITVRTGDVLVQPFRTLQIYRSTNSKAKSQIHALRIVFGLSMLQASMEGLPPKRAKPRKAEVEMQAFVEYHLSDVYHLPGFLTFRHYEMIKQIRAEAEARRSGHRFWISSLCFELIVDVVRTINGGKDRPATKALSRSTVSMDRVKEYLVENLAQPLTLDDIAWQVRLSREHLARTFREATGQTVFEYLTYLRIETAKSLLYSTSQMMHEVAVNSGFTSATLFGRTFKRLVGMTPLAYRRKYMEELRFKPSVRKPT